MISFQDFLHLKFKKWVPGPRYNLTYYKRYWEENTRSKRKHTLPLFTFNTLVVEPHEN